MPVTTRDIQALTYLARRLRDETHGCARWDDAGTFEVFKAELLGQNLLIATQRVVGHATDPEARTPGAIKRGFVPEPTVAPTHIPFDPRETCNVCSERRESCRGRTDRNDGHTFVPIERKRTASERPDDVVVVRDGLCRHGVPPMNCAEHRPAPTKEKS